MPDDILLTPEEQDERAKQWLKDNGFAIVFGVVLGLGAVFGYNNYKDQKLADAEAASLAYSSVLESFEQSEIADIEDRVNTLKADHAATSYAAKAVLLRARQLAVSDQAAALAELQWVSDNAKEFGLQHTAKIRQAKLHLAMGSFDQAIALASQQQQDAFASHYQEILGDAAVKQDKLLEAREHYQQAIDALSASDAAYRGVLTLKMNRLPEVSVVETVQAEALDQAEAPQVKQVKEQEAEVTETGATEAE